MSWKICLLQILIFLSCSDKNKVTQEALEMDKINIDLLADLFIMEAQTELHTKDNLEAEMRLTLMQVADKHNISIEEVRAELKKIEDDPDAFSKVMSKMMDIRNEGHKKD